MTTYNGGRFISQQLESISNQSKPPHELVVCDDGSTDATIEILQKYAQYAKFPVRIILNNQRLGWRENFLKAAKCCSGNIISFCDQDDYWHPEKIRKSAEPFFDEGVALVAHTVRVTDSLLNPQYSLKQSIKRSKTFDPLENDPFLVYLGFTCTFRASILNIIDSDDRPFESEKSDGHKIAHDVWVNFLAFVFGKTVVLAEELSLYRQHSDQATGFGLTHADMKSKSLSSRIYSGRAKAEQRFRVTRDFAQQRSALLRRTLLNYSTDGHVISRAITLFDKIESHSRSRESILTQNDNLALLAPHLARALCAGLYSEYAFPRNLREFVKDFVYSRQ